MKKTIFTLAILVMVFGNAAFAQRKANLKSNEKEIVFRHYGLRNDDIQPLQATWNSVYDESYRTTYTYDEYDYWLVEELLEVDLGDGWVPDEMVAYERDFSGNVLEMTLWEYEEGVWEEELKGVFSYEGDEVSEILYQMWTGSSWLNVAKEVYNYNGDVTTVLFWEWNGSTWSSVGLYTYTYSDNSIELLTQYMQGGAWQNEGKFIYTLDFTGNVIEILEQEWYDNTWANVEQTIYVYEGGVFTEKHVKEWYGSAWEDEYRYSFVYDADGNATLGECFGFTGSDWIPADGDIEMAYHYNAANNTYYGQKAEVTYFDVTALKENAQTASFRVYPNPAKDEISIQTEDFGKAVIYSVTGQKVMESTTKSINVNHLEAGVYLLKVYDQTGKTETQRIVVK